MMKSSRELGIPTTLLFIILNSFLERRQVSLTKLIVLVFFVPSSLLWVKRKFFMLVLFD